jgi:chromosome segregation ATPase
MDRIEPRAPRGEVPENLEEAVGAFEQKIKELETKLDELKLQGHLAQAEAKTEYQDRIKEFERRKSDLLRQLDQWRKSGDEAAGSIKQGVDGAYREMRNAFDRALKAFNK